MKALFIPLIVLLTSFPVTAEDYLMGNDVKKLIRLQTVDPLAETKVPAASPPFSGKKASKSLNMEEKGVKSEQLKNKKILINNL